jgi:uncharacterized protein (UPF0332 family)
MTFDWLEYLQLDRELAGEITAASGEEAKNRSAVSRAYYAAFNKAREVLEVKDGLTVPKQNTHQYVISQFQNNSSPCRQKIGNRLRVLRSYRNQADYENKFTLTAKDNCWSLFTVSLSCKIVCFIINFPWV